MPSRRAARLGLMTASVLFALSAVEGYLRISSRAQNSQIIVHDSVRLNFGVSGYSTAQAR